MGMKFAINGFGRIGRNIIRAKIERGISSLELVAINDLASIENAAFLLDMIVCMADWKPKSVMMSAISI